MKERIVNNGTTEVSFWKLYGRISQHGIAYVKKSNIDSEFGDRLINRYSLPGLCCTSVEISNRQLMWVFIDTAKYDFRVYEDVEESRPDIVRSKIEGYRELDQKKIYPNQQLASDTPRKVFFVKPKPTPIPK